MRAALADAELEALDEEMGEAIDGFLGLERAEVPSAIVFVRAAWAKFEAWRARAGVEGRRPAGLGSVQRSGNGYQWRLSRGGKVLRGKVRPTAEEAQAELAQVIADPAFVPVPCDGARLTNGKHHCSRCGSPDHRANRCPEEPEPAIDLALPQPASAAPSPPPPSPPAPTWHSARRCATCGRGGHDRRTCPGTDPAPPDPPPSPDPQPLAADIDLGDVGDHDEDVASAGPGEPDADLPPSEADRARTKAIQVGRKSAKTIAPKRLTRDEKRLSELLVYPADVDRPMTRDECKSTTRPCPFVSCAHHLYMDVNPESGAIKLNFPHLEVWEMAETCSLDVADRGGITLEEVGAILNLTRERIRQVENRGLTKLRAHLPGEEPGG